MVTKIYLIRHCQSMGNIEHKFQGQYDADVSPAGRSSWSFWGCGFATSPST